MNAKMKKSFCVGVTFCILISGAAIAAASGSENAGSVDEKAARRFSIEVEPGRAYVNRTSFKMLQTQNEIVSPFTPGDPIANGLNDWATSVNLGGVYHVDDRSDLRATVGWFDMDLKDVYTSQAGDNGGGNPTATTLIPFIDGSTRYSQQAAEVGGDKNNPAAQADVTFKYKTQSYDVKLDHLYALVTKDHVRVSRILGLTYAYFVQDFSLKTAAVDFDNDQPSYTNTSEGLQDNLFGARAGLQAVCQLKHQIRLESSIVASLMHRMSDFSGEQHFENVSMPFTGAPSTFDTSVNGSDRAFAQRLEAKIGLVKAFKYIDVGVTYTLDAWFNMSTIVNPTIRSSGATDLTDHPAQIESEDVLRHLIAFRVRW